MKQHFPRWPTNSPDPIVNIIATGVLVLLGLLTIATSFLLLIPIGIGFGVIAFLRWYHSNPQPYANVALVAEATQQHVIAANFPDADSFRDAYVRRLTESWQPRRGRKASLSPGRSRARPEGRPTRLTQGQRSKPREKPKLASTYPPEAIPRHRTPFAERISARRGIPGGTICCAVRTPWPARVFDEKIEA